MKKSLKTANSNQVRRNQKRESGTHRFEILTLSPFFYCENTPLPPYFEKIKSKKN